MARDSLGIWCDENLNPIFAKIFDALKADDVDPLFRYIAISFSKNSIAMFESLKGHLRSYPVAQAMRLLMEFEADTDFLVKNPKNIPRMKKKTDKLRAEYVDDKKSWSKSIIDSGNMHLLDDVTKEDTTTKGRVEKVFDKDTYAFYCAYSHFNLYAICDDAENVSSFDNAYVKKTNYQKAELIKFYPVILDKFVKSLNNLLTDDNKIEYNPAKLVDAFKILLVAICKAKIRSQDV